MEPQAMDTSFSMPKILAKSDEVSHPKGVPHLLYENCNFDF